MLKKQRLKFLLACLNLLIGCVLLTTFFSICLNLIGINQAYSENNPYFYQVPISIYNAPDKNAAYDELMNRRGVVGARTTYNVQAGAVRLGGLAGEYRQLTTYIGGDFFLEADRLATEGIEVFLAGRACEKAGEAVLRYHLLEFYYPLTPEQILGKKVTVYVGVLVDGETVFEPKEYTITGIMTAEATAYFSYSQVIVQYSDEPVYIDGLTGITVQMQTKKQAADLFDYSKKMGYMSTWPYYEMFLEGRGLDFATVGIGVFGIALALLIFLNLQNTLNSMIDEKSMSYALLKSFGYSNRHNNIIVCIQSALMMISAAVISLPVTYALSKIIAGAINLSIFGIHSSTMFAWSVWAYLAALGVSLAIAVIYAIAPAKNVKKISLLQALKAC